MCLAKKKTKVVKRNLDPTYQQALLFDESPQGKVLQVGPVDSTSGQDSSSYSNICSEFTT